MQNLIAIALSELVGVSDANKNIEYKVDKIDRSLHKNGVHRNYKTALPNPLRVGSIHLFMHVDQHCMIYYVHTIYVYHM